MSAHEIINKIDEFKEKLTDQEYREVVKLLQTTHQQQGTALGMYELLCLVPIVKLDEPEEEYDDPEIVVDSEVVNIKVELTRNQGDQLKDYLSEHKRFQFSHCYCVGQVLPSCLNFLNDKIKKDLMLKTYLHNTRVNFNRDLMLKRGRVALTKRWIDVININKLY